MDIYQKGEYKLHHEKPSNRKGKTQIFHHKTVKRMHVRLSPVHESQQKETDLDDRNSEYVSFENFIVFYYVHFGHVSTQIVLDGLGQVEDRVVCEEGHGARLTCADERQDQRYAAEGEVVEEEHFVEESCPTSANLGSIRR